MDAATMGDYEKGNLKSAASERTDFRGARRLYERAILRRERLLRVLHTIGFLPKSFEKQIDFTEHPGKFLNHGEPLLPYYKDEQGKNTFLFKDSFNEMLSDFKNITPILSVMANSSPTTGLSITCAKSLKPAYYKRRIGMDYSQL